MYFLGRDSSLFALLFPVNKKGRWKSVNYIVSANTDIGIVKSTNHFAENRRENSFVDRCVQSRKGPVQQ